MLHMANLSHLMSSGSHASSGHTTMYEFIKGRLYYSSFNGAPSHKSSDTHYFNIDNDLVYCHFYNDFGPNNLSHVWRFNALMRNKMQSAELVGKKICLYTNMANDKRSNAAFLLGAYMMLEQHQTADEAFRPLESVSPAFLPYRDAGYGPATYHITVLDCLRGLQRAIKTKVFRPAEFNLAEYEFYEKVEHGDMNWLLPSKFLAFATPYDETSDEYSRIFSPYSAPRAKIDDTIAHFKKMNITTVVRLNNATYDRAKFIKAGIEHVDMYFPDGSIPSDNILYSFIELAEKRPGRIAVHCKAGLGRTGTLIAAYMMKHYGFTAPEIIAWLRLARPGCVVGPQQNYIDSIQATMRKIGPNARRLSADVIKTSKRRSSYVEVEEISVEPTADVAVTTVVDGEEYSVPVQPRKENMQGITHDINRLNVNGGGEYVLESDADESAANGYNLRSKSMLGHLSTEKRSIVKALRRSKEALTSNK